MADQKLPPGPKPKWLVGNLFEMWREQLGFLQRCAREYGPVALFHMANRRVVLLSDPELIEEVLVTQHRKFTKGHALKTLRAVLGDGLITSDGELWRRQRRLMQPAFQRGQIDSYAPIICEQAERKLAEWQAGQKLEMYGEMKQLMLAIAAKALLDVELDDRFAGLYEAVDLMMEDFVYRLGTALPIPRNWPTRWNRRVRGEIRRLDDLIYGIIAERRRAPLSGDDLLTRLMRAQDAENEESTTAPTEQESRATADTRGMSDRQLRDELITLLITGYETTASALTWAWYLLAQHPEAAARLATEVSEVLSDRAPTAADVPHLEFTEHVVLEAMRLYPPAFGISRLATETVEIGGYQLPAGTICYVSQWVTHRDARFFAEPNEFRPERWENGLARRLPKFAYFPFGGGPRVCIGNSLAMLELVLVVARIAQRFRFELVDGAVVEPSPTATLRPRHGLPVVCRAVAPVSVEERSAFSAASTSAMMPSRSLAP